MLATRLNVYLYRKLQRCFLKELKLAAVMILLGNGSTNLTGHPLLQDLITPLLLVYTPSATLCVTIPDSAHCKLSATDLLGLSHLQNVI